MTTDYFDKNNRPIFGPTKFAAQLETSKLFAREVLKKCNVKQPVFYICKTKEDVIEIKNTEKIRGVIIGKAIYDGRLRHHRIVNLLT